MGLGIGLLAAGQIYQGLAAKAQGESAQNLADYNAQLALREKAAIERRGKAESILQAKKASRQESSLRAKFGKAGVVAQAGVPLDILAEQAAESERENLLIGFDTQVAASQAQSQADLDILSGKIAKQKGKNAMTASMIGAGGTLLTGFGTSSTGTDKTIPSRSRLLSAT